MGLHSKQDFSVSHLDPLLDILISVVGLMLVMVLFAVISARGKMITQDVSVTVFAPKLQNTSPEAQRSLYICQDGRISHLDIEAIMNRLTQLHDQSDNASEFYAKIKHRVFKDQYFSYTIKTFAMPDQLIRRRESAPVVVAEIVPIVRGESLHQLNSPKSKIAASLLNTNVSNAWVHFLVDANSIEVFRAARKIAKQSGAVVGWEPIKITYPRQECLIGCVTNGGGTVELIEGHQI